VKSFRGEVGGAGNRAMIGDGGDFDGCLIVRGLWYDGVFDFDANLLVIGDKTVYDLFTDGGRGEGVECWFTDGGRGEGVECWFSFPLIGGKTFNLLKSGEGVLVVENESETDGDGLNNNSSSILSSQSRPVVPLRC